MRWRRKKDREQDLERELRSHLDLTAEELQENGLSEKEARYAAQRALGNPALVKEEVRELWGWTWLERLIQDLRYAGRQLRRSPAFTVAAVLTLALGIGANTAIFSVADALLLRPLPYPNPDRLVMVWNELTKVGEHRMELSARDFDTFRANRVFATAAAFQSQDRMLIEGGKSERVSTMASTADLWEMLGAHMSVGRRLAEEDWQADRNAVAVISHSLFARHFGNNAGVVGRTIQLDDGIYQVAGVLADDFEFGFGTGSYDVWMPLPPVSDRRRAQFIQQHFGRGLRMLALLRPGIGMQEAQASVAATAQHLKETVHPYEGPNGEDAGYRASVVSLHDQLLHDFRAGTLLLLTAVALVLLIACVNVANLLLARTMAREKEIAIRRALGASRSRLVRQWLTEAGLLAALGGAAGMAGSVWGVQVLKAISPVELPAIAHIGVDGRALVFTFAVTAIACLLSSLAPLLSVFQMTGSLRGPRRRRRLSGVLVAAEVSFALMLLVGSGLLLRSFAQLRNIDPGVRTDHLLTMLVELSGARYQRPPDRIHFFSELRNRLAQLPGVVTVSSTDRLPVFDVGVDTRGGNPFSVDGSLWNPSARDRQLAHTGTVDLDYFTTMGIPLQSGRDFSAADTADSPPVAVINQTLARRFFPGKDPVGRRILFGAPGPGARWMQIVGVIADLRTGALDLPPMPQFYMPVRQDVNARRFVVLRTTTDPLTMTRSALGILRQLDPDLPAAPVSSMEQHIDQVLGQPRFRTLLLLFFGVVALFLAAVGIYGVVAHTVIQRTNEIGIRMAMGADATRVTTTVLAGGLRPVAAGMILGFAGTAVLVRFLSSVLYQVSPSDPATLGLAAVLLALVAVMACLVPARRAARVDPVVALRYE